MWYQVYYDRRKECLMSKFVGELSKRTIQPYLMNLVKIANCHNCKKAAHDLREAEILLTLSEIYAISCDISDEEYDRTWRGAILYNDDYADKLYFYIITANNRGKRTKASKIITEALEWLQSYYRRSDLNKDLKHLTCY